MSGLSKDELKSALLSEGIELGVKSKKEDYVKLYNEHIAGKDQSGELFSDDEEQINNLKKQVLTEANSMIVDGLNIVELSDEQLFDTLKNYGVDVGPIVDSTRNIYRKKLAILLRGGGVENNHSSNGRSNGKESSGKSENGNGKEAVEEYSAGEEALELHLDTETEEEPSPKKKVSRRSTSSGTSKISSQAKKEDSSPKSPNIRQRITGMFDSSPKKKERFTPTPRRSIHTYKVTEKTTETMTKKSDGSVSRDFNYVKQTSHGDSLDGQQPSLLTRIIRFLPKLFLVCIVISVFFFIYKHHSEGHDIVSEVEEALKWAAKDSESSSDDTSTTTKTPPIPENDHVV